MTLLKKFYAHLGAGDSPALSLAEAKREFIAQFGSAAAPWYGGVLADFQAYRIRRYFP